MHEITRTATFTEAEGAVLILALADLRKTLPSGPIDTLARSAMGKLGVTHPALLLARPDATDDEIRAAHEPLNRREWRVWDAGGC